MAKKKKSSTRTHFKSGRHRAVRTEKGSRRTPSRGSAPRKKRKSTPKGAGGSKGAGRRGGASKGRKQQAGMLGGRGGRGVQKPRGTGLAVKMTGLTIMMIISIVGVYVFLAAKIISSALKREILISGRNFAELLGRDMDGIAEAFNTDNKQEASGTGTPSAVSDEIKQKREHYKRLYSKEYRDQLSKNYGIRVGFARLTTQNGIPANEFFIGAELFGATMTTGGDVVNLPQQSKDMKIKVVKISEGGKNVPFFVFTITRKFKNANLSTFLAISQRRVLDTQRDITLKLVLFGLLFIIMGVMGAVLMANTITKPTIQLVHDMEIVARGDMGHRAKVSSKDEIGMLARTFNAMAEGLLVAKQQEHELLSMEAELDTAREIQTKLLPNKIIQLPGYDLYCAYISAKDVGGDYYDFIPVDREHIAFVVADVSGKGIPGALVMSSMRTILRMNAVNNLSSSATLSATNEAVANDIKRGMFVTCIYAILNVRKREMTVSSAGHNPMIIYRAATKKYELINPEGISLGFDKGPLFSKIIREQKVTLSSGDRVMLYTDGVDESMSPTREEFGHQTLYNFVRDYATLDSKSFVNTLLEALAEHQGTAEQHDDITISTFRVL